jgi:serine/threonine protein phosphatase PrpC
METCLQDDDEFLVLASDGLWDVMSNLQVAEFVQDLNRRNQTPFINMARAICNEALLRGSTDNVTVILVDLREGARDALLRPSAVNKANKTYATQSTNGKSSKFK